MTHFLITYGVVFHELTTAFSAVTCLLIALYYNVILAWAAIYLGTSFSKELPWADCPTINGTPVPECAETSPTEYYYYRNVLDFSGWGEEGSNDIVTKVLVSNVVVWGLVFISCVKVNRTCFISRVYLNFY